MKVLLQRPLPNRVNVRNRKSLIAPLLSERLICQMEKPMACDALDKSDLIIRHNPRVISSTEAKWSVQEILRTHHNLDLEDSQLGVFLPHAKTFTVNLEQIPAQHANILKSEIADLGGCAVLMPDNGVVESWDDGMMREHPRLQPHHLIISATQSQFQNLATEGTEVVKPIAELICDCLSKYDETSFRLPCKNGKAGGRSIELSHTRTGIMGILNVTPDSFSDGSRFYSLESAVEHAHRMAIEGADIIDVGGESTRPGAARVSADEEIRRTIPVIERISQEIEVPISIDTRKAEVAKEAIQAGASIVNDIGGLKDDPMMADVIADYHLPVIIMHKKGTPENMQNAPSYVDLMSEITRFLRQSIKIAIKAGIDEEMIVIDPGIGFGKSIEHNLEILDRLGEFRSLGHPILIGTSRKSTIGKILNAPVGERLTGSLASAAVAISNGAHIVRVHDVKETVQLVKVCNAIASAGKLQTENFQVRF